VKKSTGKILLYFPKTILDQNGILTGTSNSPLIISHIFQNDPYFKHSRQEPHNLVKPSKSGTVDSEKVEKVKPTATRNLILIRHGQYNLKGTCDEERFLTSLGKSPFVFVKPQS
jgi:hypothetical protein